MHSLLLYQRPSQRLVVPSETIKSTKSESPSDHQHKTTSPSTPSSSSRAKKPPRNHCDSNNASLTRTSSQRSTTTASSQVDQILKDLNLSQYGPAFRMHCIESLLDLMSLEESQIKDDLGIWKVGERNRLQRWIAAQQTDEIIMMQPKKQQQHTKAIVSNNNNNNTREEIIVSGAGIKEANGIYQRIEQPRDDRVAYRHVTIYQGKPVQFRLRFRGSFERRKHPCWCISVMAPFGDNSRSESELYHSTTSTDVITTTDMIPKAGWIVTRYGIAPAPTIQLNNISHEAEVRQEEEPAVITVQPNVQRDTKSSPKRIRQHQLSSSQYATKPEVIHGSRKTCYGKETNKAKTKEEPLRQQQHQRRRPPPAPPVDDDQSHHRPKVSKTAPGRANCFTPQQKIIMQGAGSSFVNGVYIPTQGSEGTYSKRTSLDGRRRTVCIGRNNQNRWAVTLDNDKECCYYSAAPSVETPHLPPRFGWKQHEGSHPEPKLNHLFLDGDIGSVTTVCSSNSVSATTDQAVALCRRYRVEHASLSFINGTYLANGYADGVPKYCKTTVPSNNDSSPTSQNHCLLFRCLVKGNKRRWYISIVPVSSKPGTIHDVDYYSAKAQLGEDLPPKTGWIAVGKGKIRGAIPPRIRLESEDSMSSEQC